MRIRLPCAKSRVYNPAKPSSVLLLSVVSSIPCCLEKEFLKPNRCKARKGRSRKDGNLAGNLILNLLSTIQGASMAFR
jgi:hypothetical protein